MIVGGLWCDFELPGRFLRGVPGCNQSQHLDLAWRQPCRPLDGSSAGSLTRARENCFHSLGRKLPISCRVANLEGRSGITQRRPVGPRLSGGLECFRSGKDPGGGRKVGTSDIAMIATAIEALVMPHDQSRDGFPLATQ